MLCVKCLYSLINFGGFDGEYVMLVDNIWVVGYVCIGKCVQNIVLDEIGIGFGIGVECWCVSVWCYILVVLFDVCFVVVMVVFVVGD